MEHSSILIPLDPARLLTMDRETVRNM